MSKFKVLFIYPNTMMSTLIPMSIPILSAVLKENGYDVELFDTTYYKTEEISFEQKRVELLQLKPFDDPEYKGDRDACFRDLSKMLLDYDPDLIAISLVEDTIPLGLELLQSIRESGIPVIAGGVGVNFNQEMLLRSDLIDWICIGEGEETIVDLCQAIEQKEDVYDIENLAYLVLNSNPFDSSDKYEIEYSQKRKVLTDINNLPFPDFDIFGKDRIKRVMHGKTFRMLPVEIDRGCPFYCSYCCSAALKKLMGDGYYRRKAHGRIIEEMVYLKRKYRPDYLNFGSENILARSVEELEDFSTDYKEFIALPFWAQSRPETFDNYRKVKILKEMGVADFQLGIEHGNEKFRKEWLNRNTTDEQIKEACNLLDVYRIPFTVNNLLGFAHETRELIFDTINLNRKINCSSLKTINAYFVNPYRGTELYRRYREKDLIQSDAKSQQLTGGKEIKHLYMTRQEVLGLQRTFSLYARLDKSWYKYIKLAEDLYQWEGDIAFEILSKMYRDKYF